MSDLWLNLGWDRFAPADRAALSIMLHVCETLGIPIEWNEPADTLYITVPKGRSRKEVRIILPDSAHPTLTGEPQDDTPVLILGPETIVAWRQEPLRRADRRAKLAAKREAKEQPKVPVDAPPGTATSTLHAFRKHTTVVRNAKSHPR